MEPPQFPAGEYRPEANYDDVRRAALIDAIEAAPEFLRLAVAGLDHRQLDAKYRNWSIRQIVQHLADSHAHSYIRFKWALTEDQPLIKAYDETRWSELADARTGDVAAPLALLAGVHNCWTQLMRKMTLADFQRGFNHPETGKLVLLADALPSYAWHCRHHTGQIQWIRVQQRW
jgi:DinB superfamily